jgi:hypothetical protein
MAELDSVLAAPRTKDMDEFRDYLSQSGVLKRTGISAIIRKAGTPAPNPTWLILVPRDDPTFQVEVGLSNNDLKILAVGKMI